MAKSAAKNAKLFEDQFDDEEVLFMFRRHPVVMRKGLIISSVAILLPQLYIGFLTLVKPPEQYPSVNFFFGSLVVGLLLSVILFIPSWINWFYSVFIVTDQRIIQVTQKGFFHKSVVDMGLSQIQSINYEVAGLQATLLGFGTILIQTYIGDLVIHDVHHPAKIQKKLSHILREQGVIASDYPSQPKELEPSEEEPEAA